jgi:hypothetical protein
MPATFVGPHPAENSFITMYVQSCDNPGTELKHSESNDAVHEVTLLLTGFIKTILYAADRESQPETDSSVLANNIRNKF